MDLFSRRLVGWDYQLHLKQALVLVALRMAIQERQPAIGLIHHTDRGGQYAGLEYRAVLQRAPMLQSMSKAGDCYDNIYMESCFSTFKRELPVNGPTSREEIAEYIQYYNEKRKHSSLGYRSPKQFEEDWQTTGQSRTPSVGASPHLADA